VRPGVAKSVEEEVCALPPGGGDGDPWERRHPLVVVLQPVAHSTALDEGRKDDPRMLGERGEERGVGPPPPPEGGRVWETTPTSTPNPPAKMTVTTSPEGRWDVSADALSLLRI